MHLPSITPEMVQKAMTYVWSTANVCWQANFTADCSELLKEYDYLSHYMTADQVYKILDKV
jgi:hypothetical protein